MSRPTGAIPSLDAPHFVCPHCGVDANQAWQNARIPYNSNNNEDIDGAFRRSNCVSCEQRAYWVNATLVWPQPLVGEHPSADLDGELLDLYEEARRVAAHSPRAAAALLRLLVEKLVAKLGESKGDLNDRIIRLREKGDVSGRAVNALDAVRITGNSAVHVGQIDPEGGDDLAVVHLLFTIVNMIVEETQTLPRQVEALRKKTALDVQDRT